MRALRGEVWPAAAAALRTNFLLTVALLVVLTSRSITDNYFLLTTNQGTTSCTYYGTPSRTNYGTTSRTNYGTTYYGTTYYGTTYYGYQVIIRSTAKAAGHTWLREHLRSNYTAAWHEVLAG